jgi:hypothetical protein
MSGVQPRRLHSSECGPLSHPSLTTSADPFPQCLAVLPLLSTMASNDGLPPLGEITHKKHKRISRPSNLSKRRTIRKFSNRNSEGNLDFTISAGENSDLRPPRKRRCGLAARTAVPTQRLEVTIPSLRVALSMFGRGDNIS